MDPEFQKNPRGYLYRAANNASLNVVRARGQVSLTCETDALDVPASAVRSGVDDDMRQRLLLAVSKLKPNVAFVVLLRYEHEYSEGDIAELLGESRSKVAMTLSRARLTLKRWLCKSEVKRETQCKKRRSKTPVSISTSWKRS